MGVGEAAEGGGKVVRDLVAQGGPGLRGLGGAGAVAGQAEDRQVAGELLFPLLELALDVGAGDLLLAPGSIVSVLQDGGFKRVGLAGGKCGVEGGKLREEDATERKAVEDDVMEDKAEAMIVRGEADEEATKQRRGVHGDGGGCLGGGYPEGFLLCLCGGEMGEVDRVKGDAYLGVDDLKDILALKGKAGAPGLVAGEELVEGGFEQGGVEKAAVAECDGLVVGG